MTPTLYLRAATLDDVDTIFRWRYETVRWLSAEKGTDQWSTPFSRRKVEQWVRQGATVMACLDPFKLATPVATVTLSPTPEDGLWSPDELATPARYMSKLNRVMDPALAGVGLGSALIAWAQTRAALGGAAVLRCDVWSTNTELQEYYRRHGFRYLRTVPGRVSGALFEAPAVEVPDVPVIELDDVRVI